MIRFQILNDSGQNFQFFLQIVSHSIDMKKICMKLRGPPYLQGKAPFNCTKLYTLLSSIDFQTIATSLLYFISIRIYCQLYTEMFEV